MCPAGPLAPSSSRAAGRPFSREAVRTGIPLGMSPESHNSPTRVGAARYSPPKRGSRERSGPGRRLLAHGTAGDDVVQGVVSGYGERKDRRKRLKQTSPDVAREAVCAAQEHARAPPKFCASSFSDQAVSSGPQRSRIARRCSPQPRSNRLQIGAIRLGKRKGRDSNPGDRSRGLTVFKTVIWLY
jgi:hypothetical protein